MFVEVNCAAIPEDLIESELFGHRKGAFPGAAADKEGKFQKADGGTLFLDEVGDMSLKTQSKVLRTLDEGRFAPVGERRADHGGCARDRRRPTRIWKRRSRKGNFREDLVLPAERDSVLRAAAARAQRRHSAAGAAFPEGVLADLQPPSQGDYRRSARRADALLLAGQRARVAQSDRAHRDHESHASRSSSASICRRWSIAKAAAAPLGDFSSLHQARAAYERDYILKKLDENHGNVSRTAEVLGLERSHLYRKMKALGIAVKE